MKVVTAITSLRSEVAEARQRGIRVGLVPTMGYLHEGHISLIRKAASECGLVVVSIFVNPLQFGEGEDFDDYPRDLAGDTSAAETSGAHVVFAPGVSDIYPEKVKTTVHVSGVTEGLCGAHRPGHFDGVATVVAKLFNLVAPDRAYFGRKDAQQLAVIRQMTIDLDFPLEVVACPTIRESDGLAMSSRNAHLSPAERSAAPALVGGLREAAGLLETGERRVEVIESSLCRRIRADSMVELEYAELRDAHSMEPPGEVLGDGQYVVAVAARVGERAGAGPRLIDNFGVEILGESVSVDEGLLASAAGVEATSWE